MSIFQNLSSTTRRIVQFSIGMITWIIIDWKNLSISPTSSLIKGFIIVSIIQFFNHFGEHNKIEVYTKTRHEQDIISELSSLGFTLQKETQNKMVFTKARRWGANKIWLSKGTSYLKITLPEDHVKHFERFIS